MMTNKPKTDIQKKQEKLWQMCRTIIIGKYRKEGTTRCFTCGRECDGKNRHLGHFIPRSAGGAYLRYHLDNLRLQCYRCNIHLGGNGSEFHRRLVKEIGQEAVDRLFILKNDHSGQTKYVVEDLLESYKEDYLHWKQFAKRRYVKRK